MFIFCLGMNCVPFRGNYGMPRGQMRNNLKEYCGVITFNNNFSITIGTTAKYRDGKM